MKTLHMALFAVVIFLLAMGLCAQGVEVGGIAERLATLEAKVSAAEQEIERLRDDVQMLYDLTDEALRHVWDELDRWKVVSLEATGYAPFDNISGLCADESPWSTSTGSRPGPGTIAVNPQVIAYGTRMYVPGYGWGVAADTGAAIRARDDLIDLFFATHAEAIRWGRRKIEVIVEVGG